MCFGMFMCVCRSMCVCVCGYTYLGVSVGMCACVTHRGQRHSVPQKAVIGSREPPEC